MAEQKQNSIAIFKSENKKTEKSPDYTGVFDVNGVEYNVALWLKQAKSGKNYLGGNVNKKEPVAQAVTQQAPAPVYNDDLGF